jgi:hypothetical protein
MAPSLHVVSEAQTRRAHRTVVTNSEICKVLDQYQPRCRSAPQEPLNAAFDERRPTRDIDLQAQALENDTETTLVAMCEIAAITLDDGVIFDIETASPRRLWADRPTEVDGPAVSPGSRFADSYRKLPGFIESHRVV